MALSRISHSALLAGSEKPIHTARFARPYELDPLIGRDPQDRAASLLLGIGPYGRLLRVRSSPARRELGNMLVDAPTRGGKGLLAVSQLLTWPYSVIVNDIKGDLFYLTAGDRLKRGPVMVFDPRGVGDGFDPLRACRTEEDLRAMAVHLLHKSHEREPDPFTKRAVKMLTAIFSAGLLEGYPLLPYAAHLLHIGPEAAAGRLDILSKQHGRAENENLATRLLDRKFDDTDFSDRYLQSSWSTLTGDMDPIITETVLRSLCVSDFTPEDILCGREVVVSGKPERRPVTVYLRFPENRLLSLSPLVRLIWSSLLDELIALYDQRRGFGCNPVLALIDEAGTSPILGLPRYAATVAGRGITLEVMVQDHNQLEHAYGKYGARSLINNMDTQLYYRQSGLETSEYIEKRMGRKSGYAHSKTLHEDQQTAEGETEQAVSLMTVQDITELSETEIIGIHRNLKPFRAKRLDWREFSQFAARTKISPPPLAKLAPVPDIPPLQQGNEPEFFDIDKRE